MEMIIKEYDKILELVLAKNYDNTDSLKLAMKLTDSAITLDKSNDNLYFLKSQIDTRLKQYDNAIDDIDQALKIKSDAPGLKVIKGFLLEKEKRYEQANKSYLEALDGYNSMVKKNSLDAPTMLNRAFLIMFVHGKEKGIDEYKKLLQIFPNSRSVLDRARDFYNFDREKFIESFP